jgi:protein-glutamine gamma-glutamyltransferase
MSVAQNTRRTVLQFLLRLLFLVLPTILIVYRTLFEVNASYTWMELSVLKQTIYFSIGIAASYGLYFYRARISISLILLLILYWITGKMISNMSGEFDVFQITVQFKLYSFLFLTGWAFGLALARIRYSSIFISSLLFLITIVLVLRDPIADYTYFIRHLLPVSVYLLYMLFAAPSLTELLDSDTRKTSNLLFRALVFLLFISVILIWQTHLKNDQIAQLAELIAQQDEEDGKNGGKKKYDEEKGLLERGNKGQKPPKGKGDGGDKQKGGKEGEDGESGYKMKDTMTMNDRMSQSDYVMFCSKLYNYFPNGEPQPLYFVYHYLTKYDPKKESFIRDTAMPYFDEMRVDPSAIPMYRSRTDSSTIRNSLANQKRKYIEADVFISSNTWKHALLAPATPYFCQTIPVDSSFKDMFRSAYKVRCYTSELNNAYFVYNTSNNPQLKEYQEERYEELESVEDYSEIDSAFYAYYVDMPQGPLYDSINALAKRITKDAKTPVEKVIAVRDYFLQTDKEGKRIYKYTLNPGPPSDPNIPNATMLSNFLFRSHAGYCTYYAGASLFLLRSVGIPARFTTGFATIDRSDKNKGWYWFYASQAHAWTQVYFPGYGWLDFDMTIGNEGQREAPQPDATPPLPPPAPWLVIDGKAETAPGPQSKRLDVSFSKIIFFNEDYRLGTTTKREVDASLCRVMYGKKDTTLSAIHPGDSIVIVSYDDEAKEVPQPLTGVGIDQQVADFPSPIIADEIHIHPKDEVKQKEEEKKKEDPKPEEELTWRQIFNLIVISIASLLAIIFSIPYLIFLFLLLRMRATSDPRKKADRAYRLAIYHFHMNGTERGAETPLEFAAQKADPVFQAGFNSFMQLYLRLKYAGGQMNADDASHIQQFANQILPAVRNKITFFTSLKNYTNLSRANRFLRRPKEQDQPDSL